MNSGNSFNNKFKNSNKKGHHSTKKKGNYQRRDNEDGLDSHTESDEAVDDKGALFQKRAGPYDFMGGNSRLPGDNLDHSESEEGNNQDIPNFDGNEFAFKKRQPGGKSKAKQGKSTQKEKSSSKKRGGRNDYEVEDLEAQQITSGKKSGMNKASDTKKGNNNRFMPGGSAERSDSEEENLGGTVNFQQKNRRDDYMVNGQDMEGIIRHGGQKDNRNSHGRSRSNANEGSGGKPPLSNRGPRN